MDVFYKRYLRLSEKNKSVLNMLREDSWRLDFYVNANINIFYINMPHFFIQWFEDE